jgi:uncharacterized membrane protein YbhN (UPF0104 family)
VSRRSLAGGAFLFFALAAAVAAPRLLAPQVGNALDSLGRADPRWLWAGAVGFAVAVVASAGGWRSAIGLCGGRTTLVDATARFGIGALVNTFVPARAGDGVRLALFSRCLPRERRVLTAGGAFVVTEAARASVTGAVVLVGTAVGAVPVWPVIVAAGALVMAALVTVRARHSHAHVLAAFRALRPAAAVRLTAWVVVAALGRFAGAVAVSAAVGIHRPVMAALLIVPAIDVVGLVPLTPGNIGIASAAIAVAFRAHGVSFSHGFAAGVAFQALETAVGVSVGTASVLWLAPYTSPATRRLVLIAGAICTLVGTTVLVSVL